MVYSHISDLESQAYYEEDQVAALTSELDRYKAVVESLAENLEVLDSDLMTASEAAGALRRRQLDFEFATTKDEVDDYADDLGRDADDITEKIDEAASTATELRSALEDISYSPY